MLYMHERDQEMIFLSLQVLPMIFLSLQVLPMTDLAVNVRLLDVSCVVRSCPER